MTKYPKYTWFNIKWEREGPHDATLMEAKGYSVLLADKRRALQAIRECEKTLRALEAEFDAADRAARKAGAE